MCGVVMLALYLPSTLSCKEKHRGSDFCPNGLAISLTNQAALLAFNLSRPAAGLPLVEESLRLATRHGLSALARQIEPILNRIRDLLK